MNQKQIEAEKEALRVFQQARKRYKEACKKRLADAARFKKIPPDELTVGEFSAEMKSKEEHSKECKKRHDAECNFNVSIRQIRNEESIGGLKLPDGMKMKEAHELIDKAMKLLMETPSATDLAKLDDIQQKLNPERKNVDEVPWMKAIKDAALENERKKQEQREFADILNDGLAEEIDPWDNSEEKEGEENA